MPRKKRKPRSIVIVGRRWFHRGPGNTYNTAQIIVDGESVHKTARQYGYDDHYVTLARDWLAANGYIENGEPSSPLWRYCQDNGIKLVTTAADVGREKDL